MASNRALRLTPTVVPQSRAYATAASPQAQARAAVPAPGQRRYALVRKPLAPTVPQAAPNPLMASGGLVTTTGGGLNAVSNAAPQYSVVPRPKPPVSPAIIPDWSSWEGQISDAEKRLQTLTASQMDAQAKQQAEYNALEQIALGGGMPSAGQISALNSAALSGRQALSGALSRGGLRPGLALRQGLDAQSRELATGHQQASLLRAQETSAARNDLASMLRQMQADELGRQGVTDAASMSLANMRTDLAKQKEIARQKALEDEKSRQLAEYLAQLSFNQGVLENAVVGSQLNQ